MTDRVDINSPASYHAYPIAPTDDKSMIHGAAKLVWMPGSGGLWEYLPEQFPDYSPDMINILGSLAIHPFLIDLEMCMTKCEPVTADYRSLDKSGIVRWVRHTAVALQNGEVIGVLQDASGKRSKPLSTRYREDLLDHIPMKILRMTPDMKVVWVNQTARDSFIDWDNHYGETCHLTAFGLNEPCLGCPVVRAKETGEVQVQEFKLPDGQTFMVIGVPRYGSDGNLESLTELAQDITPAVQQRELAERHFRDMADLVANLQDGLAVLDSDKNIILSNQALCQFYPRFNTESKGDNYDTICQEQTFMSGVSVDHTLASGEMAVAEFERRDATGQTIAWYEHRCYPYNGIDKTARAIVQIRDITSDKLRQREEAQHHAVIEGILGASENAIVAFDDATGAILHVNTKMAELLNLPENLAEVKLLNKSQLVDKLAQLMVRPENFHAKVEDTEQSHKSGTGLHQGRVGCFEMVDGRLISFFISWLPEREEIKACPIWSFIDDTVDIRLELAIEANRTKDWFLKAMSHEVRTPLNGILGMVQVLLDTYPNLENIEYLKAIQDSSNDLLLVLDAILFFATLDSGGIAPKPVLFNFEQLLQECLVKARYNCKDSREKVEFTINYPPALPRTIFGDYDILQRIFYNLISNGIKFTNSGAVRINVDHTPKQITIEICDTGIGIAPAAQHRLFERFFQAEKGDTRRFDGLGLGLVTVQKLLQLIGGKINITSKLEEGTVCEVVLPLDPELAVKMDNLVKESNVSTPAGLMVIPRSDLSLRQRLSYDEKNNSKNISNYNMLMKPSWPQYVDINSKNTVQEKNDHETQLLIGIKVLVVEDNTTNRLVISKLLTKAGCIVDEAKNGREGLEMMTSNNYDLVLMDCHMPEMDGYEATRRMRQFELQHATSGKHQTIIALTASAVAGDRERCLDAGMDEYLTKPLSKEQLLKAINQHVGRQKVTQS